MSPLSYIHPHVSEYAMKEGLATVTIDLLNSPAIESPHVPRPLRLAAAALQDWFAVTLSAYGFTLQEIAEATLTCGAFGSDGYTCGASARIASVSGKVFMYHRGWPPAAN
jgi:hypothetical protein